MTPQSSAKSTPISHSQSATNARERAREAPDQHVAAGLVADRRDRLAHPISAAQRDLGLLPPGLGFDQHQQREEEDQAREG